MKEIKVKVAYWCFVGGDMMEIGLHFLHLEKLYLLI